MTEQEKRDWVIEGLKCVAETYKFYLHDLATEAIDLLKVQEPVEPIAKNRAYFCGNPCCGRILADMVPSGAPTHKIKYCSECGTAVKWE